MIYTVVVKPHSKKGPLVLVSETDPNALTVYLREKPIDGEANTALLKVLADYFRVPKTSLTIKSGEKGRRKLVEVPSIRA